MTELQHQLADDLQGAFPAFVRAHQGAVYSTAMSLSKNHHDAQDIAQETFVRAFRSLETWDRSRVVELRARPWLARIAVNLCRNAARDRTRRVTMVALGDLSPNDPNRGPEDAAEMHADVEMWRQRLAELSPGEASAIVLRHVWGLSYSEIAESAGIAEGTVKARVHRGLAKLRTTFEEVLT